MQMDSSHDSDPAPRAADENPRLAALSAEERKRLRDCLSAWAKRSRQQRKRLQDRALVSARTLDFVFSR